jgi:SHS2 domain-containing protein
MAPDTPQEAAAGARAWGTFAHGSDVGVRGEGADLAEAFANAGLALTSVVTDPSAVRATREIALACQAPDPEILLFDWLNALIEAMAVEGLIFGRYDVRIEGDRLTARAFGEPVDRSRHAPTVEVKGATLTELKVTRKNGRWLARCVVDV